MNKPSNLDHFSGSLLDFTKKEIKCLKYYNNIVEIDLLICYKIFLNNFYYET